MNWHARHARLPQQRQFGLDIARHGCQNCSECDGQIRLQRECPKHRFATTPDGEPGLNYLCAGYKNSSPHRPPHEIMANLLRHGPTGGPDHAVFSPTMNRWHGQRYSDARVFSRPQRPLPLRQWEEIQEMLPSAWHGRLAHVLRVSQLHPLAIVIISTQMPLRFLTILLLTIIHLDRRAASAIPPASSPPSNPKTRNPIRASPVSPRCMFRKTLRVHLHSARAVRRDIRRKSSAKAPR